MTIDERIAKLEKELAELKEEREKEKAVTRFEPKKGECYITLGGTGTSYQLYYDGSAPDICRTNHNNIFRTSSEENLKKYVHDVLRVQNRLMQLHEELCPWFWCDSSYINYDRFYVCNKAGKWTYDGYAVSGLAQVPFTENTAKKAAEILNAERFMMGGEKDEDD